MVWLYVIGGLVLLELLLLFLRVGVEVTPGERTQVTLRIGPLRRQLLPKREKKKEKTDGEPSTPKKKKAKTDKPKKAKPKIGFDEVKSGVEALLPALKSALRKTRRSVRIHPLTLQVIFGGYDPAAVAKTYGWANALLWSLMPEAERLLVIPEPHIRLDTDFNADRTRVSGEFGLSIRIGSLLNILATLLIPAAKWYKSLPKPVPAQPAAETPAKTEAQTTDGPQNAASDNTEQKGESYGNETRSQ